MPETKNPLVRWSETTKTEAWQKLPTAKKEEIRQAFISKNSGFDSSTKSEKARVFLDLGTRPKDTIINDPQFLQLSEEGRKKALKASLIASGEVLPEDFVKKGVFAKLPKWAMGSVAPTKGDKILDETYSTLITNPALSSGLAKPFKAVAETVGASLSAAGVGGEEMYTKARASLAEGEKNIARAPTEGMVGEITGNLATMAVNPSTFIGRVMANVGLGALTTSAGTVETPEDALTQKGIGGVISGGLGAAGEVLTSPVVRKTAGTFGRTVAAPLSGTARDTTIGRELASEVEKPILNTLREELNAEAVAKGITPDKISEYTNKRLASPEIQKRLVEESQAVLTQQRGNLLNSDTVYTAAAANSPELRRVQASAGNLDEILETSLERNIPKLTARAGDALDAMKKAGVVPATQEAIAPLQLKVYDKFVKPFVGEAAAAKDVTIKALDKSFKEAQTNIIKQARGGVLAGKSNITPKETLKKFKEVAKAIPVNELDVLKGSNAYKVVENLAKKPGNRTFTFSELANLQQRLADDMTNSGPAAQSFEEMFKVLNNSLGEANDATLTQLSQLGTDYVSNKATALASLTKESQIKKRLTGMPILRAISEGKGAEDIAKAVRTEGLSTKELAEIAKDKELLNAVRGAITADVADTLNLGSGKADAEAFYKLYGESIPTLKQLFANDKNFLSILSDISEVGKQTSAARGFSGRGGATAAQEGAGVRQVGAAAIAEGLGTRGVTAGLFGTSLEKRLHKKTVEAVRDSITDKFLAAKFYSVAKKAQAGDLKYKTLWDKGQGINFITNAAARQAAQPIPNLTNEDANPTGFKTLEEVKKGLFTAPPTAPQEPMASPTESVTPQPDTSSIERLKTSGIIESEGMEPYVYDEGAGREVVKTVGIGFNMDSGIAKTVWKKAGINKPFELVYNGEEPITEDEAVKLAETSLEIAVTDAKSAIPNFSTLDEKRQNAILHLSYQLGGPRLRGFKAFKKAIVNNDFKTAAKEVLNSDMAKQTPERAKKVAELLSENSTVQRIKYDSKGNKLG